MRRAAAALAPLRPARDSGRSARRRGAIFPWLGEVEENAVRVGEAVRAERAAGGEELQARLALGSRERQRAQVRVVVADRLEALLHRLQVLDFEPDVI